MIFFQGYDHPSAHNINYYMYLQAQGMGGGGGHQPPTHHQPPLHPGGGGHHPHHHPEYQPTHAI